MTTPCLWRKSATEQWWQRYQQLLDDVTSGRHALVERPGRARLQIECFCPTLPAARKLQLKFGGSVARLPHDWRTRLFAPPKNKPIRIGRRLVVISDASAEIPSTVSTLIIPAGAAFGTGEHATTAMSLRLLERSSRARKPGWRMLDAGTGSGILALGAKRFGAGVILGIDNDPTAVSTARENSRANALAEVRFVIGGAQENMRGRWDIIAANLYSELLVSLFPGFRKALAPGGQLILSGILRKQERSIRRALTLNTLVVRETRRRGKWIALLAEHRQKRG